MLYRQSFLQSFLALVTKRSVLKKIDINLDLGIRLIKYLANVLGVFISLSLIRLAHAFGTVVKKICLVEKTISCKTKITNSF